MKSEEHKLPPPPAAMGESNFSRVYFDVLTFCRNFDQKSLSKILLFTLEPHVAMMESIFDQLSSGTLHEDIQILSLNTLFHTLVNAGEAESLNENVTNMFLKKDTFDFAADVACDIHVNEEADLKCSLSIAHRWMFTTCSRMCGPLGIEMKSGRHKPSNSAHFEPSDACGAYKADESEDEEAQGANKWGESDTRSESAAESTCTEYSRFANTNPFVPKDRRPSSSTSFTSENSVMFPALNSRRRVVDTRRRYFE